MRITIFSFVLFCFATSPVWGQKIVPGGAVVGSSTQTVATVPGNYGDGIPLNFVRTFVPLKGISGANDITTASALADVQVQTTYLDGLGRPLQTVSNGASPLGKDLVSPVVYDVFGRQALQYLPYVSGDANGAFKTNPFSAQATFSQSQHLGELFFYGKTEFEASPLNRPLKTLAPGNSWVGSDRGVSMGYEINVANEVKLWTIGSADNAVPASITFYEANQLYRTVTTNEHLKRVVEYKDKEGQVILKKVEIGTNPSIAAHEGWLCTYYVYDDLNNLRYVIPPKAVEEVLQTGFISTESDKELCFRYNYDHRNRMIVKKVPGAAEVYMVYDARDRLVFSQDGNQRSNSRNQWMVTFYDALNRPTATGIMTYGGTVASLRSYAENAANLDVPSTVPVQGESAPLSLVVPVRVAGMTIYKASRDIEFTTGFESEKTPEDATNAEFETEITSATNSSSTLTLPGSPIPSGGTVKLLTQTFYNNYSWTSNTYSAANNGKLDAGTNPHAEAVPAVASQATKGMVTGSKTWVIEDANDLAKGRWLEAVSFYDEKGRVVQMQMDNVRGGKEETTSLFDFSGKVLSTYQVHRNPQSASSELRVKSLMEYDHGGRLLSLKKAINDASTAKTIMQNEYDELGQLKTKKLGTKPAITADPLETLAYEYNIRGWLKGINKDYVTNSNSTSYFGQTLSYDHGFTAQQYNGNIAGAQWRSKGDGMKRAYGYAYDAANRLLKADFSEGNSGSITSTDFDFSVGGNPSTGGLMKYDPNGNILEMWQKGMVRWTSDGGSGWIDNMTYSYFPTSNKLHSVTDGPFGPVTNQGDFTDKNKVGADYGYDVNGNMISDLNKKISGSVGVDQATGGAIEYNHLNLPYRITVRQDDGTTITGTITYVYDAAGTKLQKIVKELATGTKPERTTTTTYIGGFVYEHSTTGEELQFFAHEEGRARPLRNAAGTITDFAFDYFLKDHLGNVRMVLTEEQQKDIYPAATLEADKLALEKEYYTIDGDQIADQSEANGLVGYTNKNAGVDNPPVNPSFDGANSQKLYKLSKSTKMAGLGITLKVMAGDRLDIMGKSYYTQQVPNQGGNGALIVNDIITALLGTPSGPAAKGASVGPTGNYGGTHIPIDRFLENNGGIDYGSQTPRAFINYILLDEQFQFAGGGKSAVNLTPGEKNHFLELQNIAVPKSGYVYVYASNESPVNVFFDNLQVVHTRSPILEETHYYPFGLTMAGISSKAATFGGTENKYKYNEGTELNQDLGLNWYETQNRSYDPQIGRFWQIDEFGEAAQEWSLYVYGNNNPILLNDPLGLFAEGTEPAENNGAVKELEGVVVNKYSRKQKVDLYWNLLAQKVEIGSIANNSLREWLQRYDGIQNYLNKVHELTREQDIVFLESASEVATSFLPLGWLTKVRYLKKLTFFFKWRRGGAVTEQIASETVEQTIAHADDAAKSLLTKGEARRIENAATRINKPIHVVGSRANGTSRPTSDWDYVIENITNKEWKKIKNSLPGAASRIDNMPRNIDVFKGPLIPNRPAITVAPR